MNKGLIWYECELDDLNRPHNDIREEGLRWPKKQKKIDASDGWDKEEREASLTATIISITTVAKQNEERLKKIADVIGNEQNGKCEDEYFFIRNGNFYLTKYAPGESKPIKVSRGATCIEWLLKNNREITSLELSLNINKKENNNVLQYSKREPITPADVLEALKSQIRTIQEKIKDAQDGGDIERADNLENDLSSILKAIKKGKNKNGKLVVFSDQFEKARIAIRKSIKRTMDEIKQANPGLYKHLTANLHTGNVCYYANLDKIIWK